MQHDSASRITRSRVYFELPEEQKGRAMKTAIVATLGVLLSACSMGSSDHAQILQLQKQVAALSQQTTAQDSRPAVAKLQQEVAALTLEVNNASKQPTAAERAQACEIAQAAARRRIAAIRPTSQSVGLQYLSPQDQRVQQQLIQMQVQIAETACASAYGVPLPVFNDAH